MTKKIDKESSNELLGNFIEELNSLPNVEDKLEKMLSHMQKQLSHGEIKPLNRFWIMRKFCLENFKQQMPLIKRINFWEKYRQIVDEILKFKEALDEKTAFSKEQIEKALDSIEQDLNSLPKVLSKIATILVPEDCRYLKKNAEFYQETQKHLVCFNSFAKRLNDLKNEVLNLEIPFKDKQKVLDKVHKLSDIVFPKRRELLSLMSRKYLEDVGQFTKMSLSENEYNIPLYTLKEEIKVLQTFAKTISLNVTAFSKCREKLSKCWDEIKDLEKEQKKMKEEQRNLLSENNKTIEERIHKLQKSKENLDEKEFNRTFDEIEQSIKTYELTKIQRKDLRESLLLLSNRPSQFNSSSETDDYFIYVQKNIKKFQKNLSDDISLLIQNYFSLMEEIDFSKIFEAHQLKIERTLATLRESILYKLIVALKEGQFSEDLLIDIEDFKKSLKECNEQYRKALNTSNQSIEKAMMYNELLTLSRSKIAELEKELQNQKINN